MSQSIYFDRVNKLREIMKSEGIAFAYIPTEDFHQSEYVGDYFKGRAYISGFTGSAGTLLVGLNDAGLWTDGRYYVQAAKELEGSGITLFKDGSAGVPKLIDYIVDNAKEGEVVALDGRVISAKDGAELKERLEAKGATLRVDIDLVDKVWADRPELFPRRAVYELDVKYAGKSAEDKINDIREFMKSEAASVHVVTSLEDIAWILNVRGNDIENCPVVISNLVITMEEVAWFTHKSDVPAELIKKLNSIGIIVGEYDELLDYIAGIEGGQTVLVDEKKVNFAIINSFAKDIKIKNAQNPSLKMKAIKNKTEQENTIKAHIKDGVAVTKFMYWLKTNIGKIPMTEISTSDYQEMLRKECGNILNEDGTNSMVGLSFDTISAYNANAAMMHYSASEESNAVLEPRGMLLMDSGGHYLEGSTDITRTYILGEVDAEWKKHYTLVVKSMLNLANARFLYGCTGLNLDILARGPLWDIGLDYRCGTGHGVGYLLSVHEGPNGFRWRMVKERNDSGVLEAGMITTDEPGVYEEGSHGIRIENELLCREDYENEYGRYMSFETITYAPIDLDGIDTSYLEKKDIERLNNYHAMVYEKVSPFLTEDEKEWLKEYTRAI
ncbi:MAG: aminopeptidase P family protein [Lachnospiraceae bacterium]|nr:aminopeptidase P family protein [Lachnospiraceae bacterium]